MRFTPLYDSTFFQEFLKCVRLLRNRCFELYSESLYLPQIYLHSEIVFFRQFCLINDDDDGGCGGDGSHGGSGINNYFNVL